VDGTGSGYGALCKRAGRVRAGEGAMTASRLTRRIGLIVATIALFAAMAGWVSDTEAASSRKPKSNSQMRYYGGPKSPMWRGQ